MRHTTGIALKYFNRGKYDAGVRDEVKIEANSVSTE